MVNFQSRFNALYYLDHNLSRKIPASNPQKAILPATHINPEIPDSISISVHKRNPMKNPKIAPHTKWIQKPNQSYSFSILKFITDIIQNAQYCNIVDSVYYNIVSYEVLPSFTSSKLSTKKKSDVW